MLSPNILVLQSARYYHTDRCVSITSSESNQKTKKSGGTGTQQRTVQYMGAISSRHVQTWWVAAQTIAICNTNIPHSVPHLIKFFLFRSPIFFCALLQIKSNNLNFHTNISLKIKIIMMCSEWGPILSTLCLRQGLQPMRPSQKKLSQTDSAIRILEKRQLQSKVRLRFFISTGSQAIHNIL